jgi:hypothetical protein
VDGAATPASLADLDDKGLPYLVEVADGASMASRRALEARGLRYLVPVLVDATPAAKASLAAQGLRYAVQVDADILPADRLVLQRQGLACYVEVDSSGNSVSAAAVGGAALLVGETNGFATDFLWPVDAERVAVKTAGTVVSSGTSFFTNSGTSSKWVYNAAGVLVNIPAGTLALDYDPVTHAAKGLLVEPQATNLVTDSASGQVGHLWIAQGATATGGQPDPSGGNEAAQVAVTVNTAGNNYFRSFGTLTNGATYTASMWLKGTAGQQIYFSANTSQTGTHNILVTFTGTWQRITSTVVVNATLAYMGIETLNRGGGANLPNVTFQCWGGQYEAGTVATSYIPTLAATATRAVDQVKLTPASINYSATAGNWWVDLNQIRLVAAGQDRIIAYASSSYAPMYFGNLGVFNLYDGPVIGVTGIVAAGDHKIAMAFQTGDRAIAADNNGPTTDATAGINLGTPGAEISIGCSVGGGEPIHGYIKKIRYLTRRPPNAELKGTTL